MDTADHAARQVTVPVLDYSEPPAGSDRRAFMMRSSLALAVAALTGCKPADISKAPAKSPGGAAVSLDPNLDVVKKSKGPVITTIDEFYKVGPGPSSSHTIGPMRITYDFYQRCTKLPPETQAKATAMKVNLFGSLSATGKGHGTERAALAGIVGQGAGHGRPRLPGRPGGQSEPGVPGEAGELDLQRVAEGHHLRRPERELPAPQHHDLQAHGRATRCCWSRSTTRWAAASSSGRATCPRPRGAPKYPYETIKEVIDHCTKNNLSLAQLAMANEVRCRARARPTSTPSATRSWAPCAPTVKTGLAAPTSVLPGPIKLKTKAHDVYQSALQQTGTARKAIGLGRPMRWRGRRRTRVATW
jgi:L-serine dehydratase